MTLKITYSCLTGTALEFLTPGSDGQSPYDKFMIAIAGSLNTRVEYVDVFSVLDSESSPGFVDVRFTAHGSPYYNTTKLIGAVLADGGVSLTSFTEFFVTLCLLIIVIKMH